MMNHIDISISKKTKSRQILVPQALSSASNPTLKFGKKLPHLDFCNAFVQEFGCYEAEGG